MKNVLNFNQFINENFEDDKPFEPTGHYTVSNAGGYEVEISRDGDSARIRDAYGSEEPKVSDWFEIEYIPNEDDLNGDLIPVIDPKGYNIPLDKVMRMNR